MISAVIHTLYSILKLKPTAICERDLVMSSTTGRHASHTLSGSSKPSWGKGTFSLQHLLHRTKPHCLQWCLRRIWLNLLVHTIHELASSSAIHLKRQKGRNEGWEVRRKKKLTGEQEYLFLEYPTTTGFQWGHLKNGPYTYTVSEGNGRVS